MPKIIYDMLQQRMVDQAPGASTGYMSFDRLAETLKIANELREGERIVAFIVDGTGLHYRVENFPTEARQ